MKALALPALLVWLAAGPAAQAADAPVLDHVRQAGLVRCGGPAGPDLAAPDAAGTWHGLMVDVCRAVAVAVLGDRAQTTYVPYTSDADFTAPAQTRVDIAFLTAGDLIDHNLLETRLPGPPVYYRTIALAVPPESTVESAAALGSRTICFEPGTVADRAVESFFAAHNLPLHPMPFQETEEMLDAFDDGRCGAMAADIIALAGARILPDIINATAILATTSLDDASWAAVVHWTIATLLRAEANGTSDPTVLLPIAAPSLGLAAGWQAHVIAAVGDYAAIYRRNLPDLPRGPNALAQHGGLLVPPASE